MKQKCINCKHLVGIGEKFIFCETTAHPYPTKECKKFLFRFNNCKLFKEKEND